MIPQETRWLQCEFCGKIAIEDEFGSYGGEHINIGTCKECYKNNPEVEKKLQSKITGTRNKREPNICPKCGGSLRNRNGPYGEFLGCSNFPSYRYSRKIYN